MRRQRVPTRATSRTRIGRDGARDRPQTAPDLWGSLGVLLGALAAWPYTVDDAYIVGRYARHVAQGLGYTMNPGTEPTDGVTGPLWILPGLLGAAVFDAPVGTAKIAGLLCAPSAAALVLHRIRDRAGGRVAAWYAAAVLVLQPSYATWAVAGLEGGAAALALALVAYGTSIAVAGVALGGLCWLRPELLPAAILVLFSRPGRQRLIAALALGLTLGAGVVALRLGMFGTMGPLALRAKPAVLHEGVSYVLRGMLIISGGFGGIALAAAYRLGNRRDRVIVAALGVCVGCLALAGGDWMPGFRLFAPVLPLYAAMVGVGLSRLQLRRPCLSLLLLLGTVTVPSLDFAVRIPALHDAARTRETTGRRLAARVRAHGGPLALVDAGFVPFVSGVHVLDLGGVTDPAVANLAGGHLDKRVPPELLQRRGVTQILLHSRTRPRVSRHRTLQSLDGYPVERRLSRTTLVRRRFVVEDTVYYAPNYYYTWLVRSPARPIPIEPAQNETVAPPHAAVPARSADARRWHVGLAAAR